MYKFFIENINDFSDKRDLIKELPTERQNKFYSLKKEADQLACLTAGLMIKKYVGTQKILFNDYGKPYIEDGVCFNVSHSKDLVMLVLNETQIGCDIEFRADENFMGLALTSFSKREYAYLKSKQFNKETFYQIWTLKESYMKYIGKGFSLSSKDFTILPNKKIKLYSKSKGECEKTEFICYNYQNEYTIAICYNTSPV